LEKQPSATLQLVLIYYFVWFSVCWHAFQFLKLEQTTPIALRPPKFLDIIEPNSTVLTPHPKQTHTHHTCFQDNMIRHDYEDLWAHPAGPRLPRGLTSLNLSRNRLRGAVGAATLGGACVALQYLNLAANQLTGPVPETVGELGNLRDLRLGDNRLTGPLPRDLTRLANLRTLSLRSNDCE
jgi:Leucine-rich repeat (LRR) protein